VFCLTYIATGRVVAGFSGFSSVRLRPGPRHCLLGLAILALSGIAVRPASASNFASITNFVKTANDQTNLQWTFPIGSYTTTNAWATPFNITSDANGKNFSEISGTGSRLVISNLDLANVTAVYTLMNAYAPISGPLASVTFIGSEGASQSFVLAGGIGIRDFYQGSFQNTINGTTTRNAYLINSVQGAAGTGNSGTGLSGTYRLDEQMFALTNLFLGQKLSSIIFSNLNGSSTPFLVGVSAEQIAAPILNIQPAQAGSVTLFWPATNGVFRLQQNGSPAVSNWTDNTNAVGLVNGTNQVGLNAVSNQLFFRLVAP